ncbi:hypothetical protein BJV74DRAFT_880689 [Russula compacta]|nr:hypothetical protein BJV74DRAFT_880689 [Russula compacta]
MPSRVWFVNRANDAANAYKVKWKSPHAGLSLGADVKPSDFQEALWTVPVTSSVPSDQASRDTVTVTAVTIQTFCYPLNFDTKTTIMTRGDERERARQKAQKKAAEKKSKPKESGTSLAKRKESDAEALRAKQKKKEEERAAATATAATASKGGK